MRLFYISSACGFKFQQRLSDEDENIISAFQQLEKIKKNFKMEKFLLHREPKTLLFSRIHSFRPDFILSFRGSFFPEFAVGELTRLKIPVGIWVVDDPYRLKTHESLVKPYHLVITQDRGSIPFYKALKKEVIHLPLAVNPYKYRPVSVPNRYKTDICFVGSAFPIRINYFDRLTPLLLSKKTIIVGQWWERLKNYSKLKHLINNEPIPPSEVVKYYNGAKIVLNIHRTNNDRKDNPKNFPAFTPNNRTFEIASCRAFQLTSARQDLGNYYDLTDEMISFSNLKDLHAKIEFYLKNDDEREQVALKAYHRTLAQHTYVKRLSKLISYLENRL